MARALARHDEIIDRVVVSCGGRVQDRAGDGVFAIVASGNPLDCALALQLAIEAEDWSEVGGLAIRVGVHCGRDAHDRVSINRAARIAESAWPGQIIVSEDAASRYGAPAGARFVDLGRMRFRGVAEPLALVGLVHPDLKRTDFPPPRAQAPQAFAHSQALSAMHGREVELAAVIGQLSIGRQLTLVGAGGNGKTRLALEVAAQLGSTRPVHFVRLADVEADDQLATALGVALRFPFHPRESHERQLLEYLRERRMLLILDNADAIAGKTRFVTELVGACAEIIVLTTSREPLGFRGEMVLRLSGLERPGPSEEACLNAPASLLFAEEARRVAPDFRLAANDAAALREIIDLLAGSPLGLVLTARWAHVFTVAEMRDALRSSLDLLRQSPSIGLPVLEEVFDASWRLLTPAQRQALALLSFFAGSFDRAAAETVAGADAFVLAAFEGKCLIEKADARRFALHPLVRDYVRRKHTGSEGERTGSQRFSHHYLELVRDCFGAARGPAQAAMLDRVETELPNISAAWRIALKEGFSDRLANTSEALFYMLAQRCHFRECALLLGNAPEELSTLFAALRANALVHDGEYDDAEALATSVLGRDDVSGAHAHARQALGNIAHIRADWERARGHYTAALADRLARGDEFGSYYSAISLAWIELQAGDLKRARALTAESERLCHQTGNWGGMLAVHACAGDIAFRETRKADARERYLEAIQTETRVRNPQQRAATLIKLAGVHEAEGDQASALARLDEAVELARAIGERRVELNASLALARALDQADPLRALAQWRGILRAARSLWPRRAVAGLLPDFGKLAERVGATSLAKVAALLLTIAVETPSAPATKAPSAWDDQFDELLARLEAHALS